VGYEWTLGHGVLTPSNSGDSFFALPDTGAILFNDGILVYSEYERVPMGIVNLKEPSKGLIDFGDEFVKEPLVDIAITPDGKYIGQVKSQGEENVFKIVDASTGASVSQYPNTVYAGQIDFLPDAYAAVLLSKIDVNSKTAQVFVWNFLRE